MKINTKKLFMFEQVYLATLAEQEYNLKCFLQKNI